MPGFLIFDRLLLHATSIMLAALTAAMTVVVLLGVFTRYVLNDALPWTEELARYILIWLSWLGGEIAMRRGSHIAVDLFIDKLSPRTRSVVVLLGRSLVLVFLAICVVYGIDLARRVGMQSTIALGISMQNSICVGAGRSGADALSSPGHHVRAPSLGAARPADGTLIVEVGMLGIVLFGGMLLLMLFGVPIIFSIGIAAVLGTFVIGDAAPWIVIPSSMINGMESFPLMAVPFFILAGELMNRGGIAERLVNFANSLVGHVHGGLGHATVVSNTLLSLDTGSALAQVAAIGRIMIPQMERRGYSREFATALACSSALLGPIIPPSVIMVIYSVAAGASVGQLFLAGIVPASSSLSP